MICDTCLIENESISVYEKCACGGIFRAVCERLGCSLPATRPIYGLGYIALVCQTHYSAASHIDRQDAIYFRHAEG